MARLLSSLLIVSALVAVAAAAPNFRKLQADPPTVAAAAAPGYGAPGYGAPAPSYPPGYDNSYNNNQNIPKPIRSDENPQLDLGLDNNGKGGGIGQSKSGQQQHGLIKTEATAEVDVPSDFVKSCVAINLKEYADVYYPATKEAAARYPSADPLRKALQKLESKLNAESSRLLAYLNQAVKEGSAKRVRDEGARIEPIYDYGCAYVCDYSNPQIVGYKATHKVCFDARLGQVSQLVKGSLNYGATDVESMDHVASEKNQLKGELIAIQRATAEAFLKAQAVAHALFLIEPNRDNNNKHNGPAQMGNSYGSSGSYNNYNDNFGSGGYSPGHSLFDDRFYDDRYDSGRGYDSKNFYEDYFGGSFFSDKARFDDKQKQQEMNKNKDMQEEAELRLVAIACQRVDKDQHHSYPLMKRSENDSGKLYATSDVSASAGSYYPDAYYPMPQAMSPVAIEIAVHCDLKVELRREQNKQW